MVSEEDFYGGAVYNNISATLQLFGSKRVWTITATASQLVNLPDARDLRLGGPHFYVINLGSNSFTLRDKANVILETVAQNELVLCALAENLTIAGKWFHLKRSLLT